MKDFLASVASLLVIVGVVSITPDSWFLERIEDITAATISNSQAAERNHQLIVDVRATIEDHDEIHNNDALVIANRLENNRLLTEEYFESLSRQIRVGSLEQEITTITDSIARERAELDRLMRIINGNSAAGPSEETFRARDRAQVNITTFEARLDSRVRELNRLMR